MMRILKCITVCFLCLLIHLSFIIATAVCSPWRPSLPVSSLLYSTAFSSLSFSPCLALSQTLGTPRSVKSGCVVRAQLVQMALCKMPTALHASATNV